MPHDPNRKQSPSATPVDRAATAPAGTQAPASASGAPSNIEKDPDDWTTGGETMTGAQASYLQTLSQEAGVAFDPNLSKADASKQIDALQSQTGRGRNH